MPSRAHIVAHSHPIYATLIPSRLYNRITSPARWPKNILPGVINQRIERAEREIDALVYRLYGLSKDEVAIVEGG